MESRVHRLQEDGLGDIAMQSKFKQLALLVTYLLQNCIRSVECQVILDLNNAFVVNVAPNLSTISSKNSIRAAVMDGDCNGLYFTEDRCSVIASE